MYVWMNPRSAFDNSNILYTILYKRGRSRWFTMCYKHNSSNGSINIVLPWMGENGTKSRLLNERFQLMLEALVSIETVSVLGLRLKTAHTIGWTKYNKLSFSQFRQIGVGLHYQNIRPVSLAVWPPSELTVLSSCKGVQL